jgi:hypothetical protein
VEVGARFAWRDGCVWRADFGCQISDIRKSFNAETRSSRRRETREQRETQEHGEESLCHKEQMKGRDESQGYTDGKKDITMAGF